MSAFLTFYLFNFSHLPMRKNLYKKNTRRLTGVLITATYAVFLRLARSARLPHITP